MGPYVGGDVGPDVGPYVGTDVCPDVDPDVGIKRNKVRGD